MKLFVFFALAGISFGQATYRGYPVGGLVESFSNGVAFPDKSGGGRFVDCVKHDGVQYCPEGRYVQIQDEKPVESKQPFVIRDWESLNGRVPLGGVHQEVPKTDPGICLGEGCHRIDLPFAYTSPCIHKASGYIDGEWFQYCGDPIESKPSNLLPIIPSDSSSCVQDALGYVVCYEPVPTLKKEEKAPSCSLWVLNGDNGLDFLYCGDHYATPQEIEEGDHTYQTFNEGDKGIRKHKETKPSIREFYPPDPDKGPRVLKSGLKIK